MNGDDLIGLDEIGDALREREGPPHPQPRRTRSRVSRVALACVFAALVVGGAAALVAGRGEGREQHAAGGGGSAAAACAAGIEWHGTFYAGIKPEVPVKLGGSLDDGTEPPCNDTVGGTPSGGGSRAVAAIEGISPEQAIASTGDPTLVYVAPGWLAELPQTPLHDLIYGPSAVEPNERTECEPGHTTTANVHARVRVAGLGALTVTLLEPTSLPHENWIFPDARTVVSGGGSPPRVEPGDVVRAQVLVCRHGDDPHFLKLVAKRLELPG